MTIELKSIPATNMIPDSLRALLNQHTTQETSTRFKNIRHELSEYGCKYAIERQNLDPRLYPLMVDHADDKDRVWLKHISEDGTLFVLNTVEDHYGLEAHHGEIVTIHVKIHYIDHKRRGIRKSHLVDHEFIKSKFGDRANAEFDAAMGPEVAKLHLANPFFRFIYGRALWTYVPIDVARQIDVVLAAKLSVGEANLQRQSWSYMTYPRFGEQPLQPLQYLPPRTDHTAWLERAATEWDYATDEQRALMQRCVAQMEADGTVVSPLLKTVFNGELE